MNIRFAKKEDIEQIVDLCEAHAHYEKATYSKHGKAALLLEYLFSQQEVVYCLVVEEQAHIVGYATFMKQFSTWSASHYLYLDCLFLADSTRGKGIGKQLMEKLQEIAIQKKCSSIEWQTPTFNESAIRFYDKLGAISKSKERFFWTSN